MLKLIYSAIEHISKGYYLSFLKDMNNYIEVQRFKLKRILERNRDTLFGREFGFKDISNISEYRRRVPVLKYKDIEPYIHRIMKGEKDVLTSEDVFLLHPTGGSVGMKLIPYTKSLRREFDMGIFPWLYDVLKNFPDIKSGKAYWVITPSMNIKFPPSKVRIGFLEDNEYFGLYGYIIDKLQAVPHSITKCKFLENFKFLVSLYLLREGNLTWLSLWSPTFLLVILDYICENIEDLVKGIYDGEILLPDGNTLSLKPNIGRARFIERVFSSGMEYANLWKDLRFISCWMSSDSKYFAEKLKRIFKYSHFQPKGLLLTEGIVSFPLEDADGCVISYKSHYYEFLCKDSGDFVEMNELEEGRIYKVIITTSGGLYRYDTEDLIKVLGFYNGLPVVDFIGRDDRVSDMVGEKLSEIFVKECIENVLKKIPLKFHFLQIIPVVNEEGRFYTVVIDTDEKDNVISKFCESLEMEFRKNPYYAHAVSLGQLKPLRWEKLRGALKNYISTRSKTQKLGNIKPFVLETQMKNLVARPLDKKPFHP